MGQSSGLTGEGAILPNIPDRVEQIGKSCPNSQLIINLSLDGIGAKHDYIRGIPGNFAKFEERLKQLLELRKSLKNLTVGIHSVISVFSVGHLDELIAYADKSGADQFITEIAEPRVELDTVGLPITPKPEDFPKAINPLLPLSKANPTGAWPPSPKPFASNITNS